MLTKERLFVTSLPASLNKAKKVLKTLHNSGLNEFRQDWTLKSLSRLGELALVVAQAKVSSPALRRDLIESIVKRLRLKSGDDPSVGRTAEQLEEDLIRFLKAPREDLSSIKW